MRALLISLQLPIQNGNLMFSPYYHSLSCVLFAQLDRKPTLQYLPEIPSLREVSFEQQREVGIESHLFFGFGDSVRLIHDDPK